MLNGGDRSQRNTLQNITGCDGKDLVPGWYRFQGAAGYQMADKCIPMFRCGTDVPGWLSGVHPTVAEGVVTRRVCYTWYNNCCKWNNTIRVRNCGAYYVYELSWTPVCPARYCGNAGASELLSVSAKKTNKHQLVLVILFKKRLLIMFAAMFALRNLTSLQNVSEKFASVSFF